MARLPDLEAFSEEHGLKLCTVPDLIQYRLKCDSLVYRVASAELPTRSGGPFDAVVYNTHVDSSEHLALVKGELLPDKETLVRVQSKYVAGDVFETTFTSPGSPFPNSRWVIHRSMEIIANEGNGVILYLQVEGKEMGPLYHTAGDDRDFKEYGIGAQILRDLGLRKIRLLTDNPKNLVALSGYGLEITASVPLGS